MAIFLIRFHQQVKKVLVNLLTEATNANSSGVKKDPT